MPTQKIPAVISVQDDKNLNTFNELSKVVSSLCKFNDLKIGKNLEKPAGAASTVFHGIEIHLIVAGSIDIDKEKQRLEKEIARLEGNIRGCENKLNNEKFVNNSAPAVVQNERDKLASMKASLEKNRKNLENLLK